MKKVLISSFDMEVGGVERSLISMLENLDYQQYDVDLMLYRHQGDLMKLLPKDPRLLEELPEYATFRKPTSEILKEKQIGLAVTRILAKVYADFIGKIKGVSEPGTFQMQVMWKWALTFLPKLDKQYDVAISFLWPHYFVAEKVQAKKKIAWIHTDYSKIDTHIKMDLKMWNQFDHIVAVSEECKNAFLEKYSELKGKVVVIENITSPEFVRKMAEENTENIMVKDSKFKIVTVARLSHAKGIDNAVKALKILKDKGYDFVWYVVGYGGDENLIKRLIKEYNLDDNFILLGKQINPYPYINAADIYVQPSRYEGKAVTVVEAQILSKPVMITNYSTATSQVKNGIDGYITDLSVMGIVEGIEKLYKDSNFRLKLSINCGNQDYRNERELEKLYELFNSSEKIIKEVTW